MKSLLLILFVFLVRITIPATGYGATGTELINTELKNGFEMLFNGKDFAGWYGDTEEGWRVEDGLIICEGETIWSEREFDNFILRFDFRLTPSANNGLGIRLPRFGFAAYDGMEIQIMDDTGERWKEGLNPHSLTGGVHGLAAPLPGQLNPVGEWNSMEVIANGRQITNTLNGVKILDVDLDEATKYGCDNRLDNLHHPGINRTKGALCFQGHANLEDNRVDFRNVRIKAIENPRQPKPENAGFAPLFNRKDLTGWQGDTAGWEVGSGTSEDEFTLIGRSGGLYTEKTYEDFVFHFKFRQRGDAKCGLLVRAEQNQLEPVYDIAAIGKKYLKPSGQWNFQEIRVKGSRVTVNVNGHIVLDRDLATVTATADTDEVPVLNPSGLKRDSGHIGFRADPTEQDNRTDFCFIRIKEL